MPLDRQVARLLQAMAVPGARPLTDMTVREARLDASQYIALQGDPEPVAKVSYIFIPGPTADLPARVYYPDGKAPFPTLIYFHGSGFVIGNIGVCDATSRSLANRSGCAVVAVNYQKAPERPFPAAIDDAFAATKWVAANAEALDLDPRRIGVVGDSAGGNLAAAVSLRARNEGGPPLACQVLIYPVTDNDIDTESYRSYAQGYLLERASMQWFLDHYFADPADREKPYAAPLREADHRNLPPALVVTAEYDPLRTEGTMYAAKLLDAGVDTTLWDWPGVVHGFFWMQGVLDASKRLHDEIGMWVRNKI
ncbi:alpha/beta hydrolase [Arthrobacter sp. KNU40]|uniref:alpha/beta hydrolase n=1 Tax=Arthrobacter sp. KNU40 TaxID=3447965 RepID=UPI003F644F11